MKLLAIVLCFLSVVLGLITFFAGLFFVQGFPHNDRGGLANLNARQGRNSMADDDHGPLAFQETLPADCPTVRVRTGASFVRHVETGIVVDRLPPGASCVEGDEDAVAFDDFIDAIDQAQVIDRPSVRAITAKQFNTKCIVNDVILALKVACAAANIETKDPL